MTEPAPPTRGPAQAADSGSARDPGPPRRRMLPGRRAVLLGGGLAAGAAGASAVWALASQSGTAPAAAPSGIPRTTT